MSLILAERPANGGLLQISHQSPGSDFGHSQSETADSLRRTLEKLPFLGDCGRRPGSICTAWPSLQCNSPNSLPWPPANWECRARTAARWQESLLAASPLPGKFLEAKLMRRVLGTVAIAAAYALGTFIGRREFLNPAAIGDIVWDFEQTANGSYATKGQHSTFSRIRRC